MKVKWIENQARVLLSSAVQFSRPIKVCPLSSHIGDIFHHYFHIESLLTSSGFLCVLINVVWLHMEEEGKIATLKWGVKSHHFSWFSLVPLLTLFSRFSLELRINNTIISLNKTEEQIGRTLYKSSTG